MSSEKLCFLVSWFDKNAGANRDFHLYFYANEKSFEMFDLNSKKMFLRKTVCDKINLGDLYIGNVIVLFSRSLTILDYGDEFTRNNCNKLESSFGLIKPVGLSQAGELLEKVQNQGLTIARVKMIKLSRHQAEMIYSGTRTHTSFNNLVSELCDSSSIVFEFVGEDIKRKWNFLLNEVSSEVDVVYSPTSLEDSVTLLTYFFPKSRSMAQTSACFNYSTQLNTTCCVIRPHAYDRAGRIVQDILDAGYTIKAMETFLLDYSKAEEFMEVYKGVVDNYGEVIKELSSGICLALQIVGELDNDVDIVSRFRKYCGPIDPIVAKSLRPGTLRAKYGESLIKNAVHCTDLIDDGPLEVEYFFKILQ